MSGRKTDKDRPGFAAMLKAAHQLCFKVFFERSGDPSVLAGFSFWIAISSITPPVKQFSSRG
jgi:hypothetical protein